MPNEEAVLIIVSLCQTDHEPGKRPERPAYVRGRLRQAAAFWSRICHSSVVLAWIMQGYMIQWAGIPPQPFVADNLGGALTHAEWVSQQIWDLQCKGSVVPVSMVPTVVSPLNVVLRRGKPRLVLDLTYVNSFIDTSGLKFKYEQLSWASVVVQPNDLLFSVDLEAAYHHVEMHPSSWRYLGFCWGGQYYVFTVLPFGLNTACWVFTKLTRELVSHWRGQGIRSVHYLDDFLFAIPKDADGGSTQFRAVQAKILADIDAAGFSLSEPKLKLDPSQVLEFLGHIVDLVKNLLTVTDTRVREFKETLEFCLSHPRRLHVKTLSRLAGALQSMSLAVGPAVHIFTRAIYDLISTKPLHVWNWHVNLDDAAKQELLFWQANFDKLHGVPFWQNLQTETLLFTDAGAQGWGGYTVSSSSGFKAQVAVGMDDFLADHRSQIAQGYLSPTEQLESSTWRELIAIERVLLSLGHLLAGKVVRLFTDNQAVTFLWAKGSRKRHINIVVMRIFEKCRELQIKLVIEWIPREANQIADYLSKLYDSDDWMLNRKYFRMLDRKWGPFTFDRFASACNAQCVSFNSRYWCPGSAGIDALAYDWSGQNNWVNPPFALIGRVIAHMSACKARGVLVVPFWPRQAWWPLVRSSCGARWAPFVVENMPLPSVDDLFLPGPGSANSRMVGKPKWSVYALKVDFSRE